MQSDLKNDVIVTLPVSDITTQFAGRSVTDKMCIIELGLNLFTKGHETYQLWNNNEWQIQLESLQEELRREKKKNSDEKNELIERIRNEEILKSDSRITALSSNITDLEQHNKGLLAQIQTIYATTEQRYTDRIHNIGIKHDEVIKDMQNRLDQSRTSYETLLGRNNISTYKGQEGENMIDKQITMMFPKAEIEDTSQQSGRGDIIVKDGDFVMMIESKNYAKNVQKSEIDKFYRDLDREINNDIQCAVFVSLNTGICCRDDFTFEVVNKKPVLFIHNLKNNFSSLRLAVNLFKNILSSNDLDLTNKEVICLFKNTATTIKRNFTKQKKILDKYHSEQIEAISQLECSIGEIYKMVNVKY